MRTTLFRPRSAAAAAAVTLVLASAFPLACGGSETKPATPSSGSGSEGASGGGSPGPGASGATTPASGPGGDNSSGSGAPAASGPTTTTTTSLGKGGELTGAKLTSSSSSSVEIKSDGGAKPDPHSSEPGRGKEDIQARVASIRDDARKCYDEALKSHPGIEGDLDIKWTIDPKGVVADIAPDDSKSQIHEAQVSNCIMAILKKIKFAESAKGLETRTHYPFNFHPKMGQTKK